MLQKTSALRRVALFATMAGVVGGVGFAAAQIYSTPVDNAGERLLAALGDATGLRIQSNGAAQVSLFPKPHVRIPGVRLARWDDPPFAVARELVGTLGVGALLRGRVELSEITLVQPEVALDRAPIRDTLAGLRRGGAAAQPPALRISDGRLSVAGRVIDRVDAGLVWPREGGPLSITGFGRYSGQPVEATFQLTDLGALARGERAPFRARIEGGGARLMFDGEAIDREGPKLTGEISARATSLTDTLSWLGLGRPAKDGPRFSFSLAGRGALDAQGLAVSNAELDLSGDSFMGAGRLTTTSDGRPSIEATVDSGPLDIRPYAAVLAPEILRQDGGWSAADIDLAGLQGWTLDLRLSAAQIDFGRLSLGRTAATIAVGRGGLDLSIGEAEAYGGSIGGRLSLEPDPRGVKLTLEGAATDVAVDEALGSVMKSPPLSGALTGELAVTGVGVSTAEFVANLAGRADGKITDGALERVGRSRTLALAGLGRRMKVENAEARFRIASGIARADPVTVVGPDASFALSGMASLVERDVRLRGTVRPASGGWALPVVLEGPLAAPKLRADLGDRTPRGEARRSVPATPAAN